jgi:hypothetical protein
MLHVARRNASLEIPGLPQDISSAAHRGATIRAYQLPSPFSAKRQKGGRCHSEVSPKAT